MLSSGAVVSVVPVVVARLLELEIVEFITPPPGRCNQLSITSKYTLKHGTVNIQHIKTQTPHSYQNVLRQ
jgi:hypothetical protein